MKGKSHEATVQVKVFPKSSRNQVMEREGGWLKIRVTAPPLEDKANKALIALLSKKLKLPKRNVEIISGARSKFKIIRIQGEAVIVRVDQKNKGIGVGFIKNFSHFEPVKLPDAVGQS